MGQTNFENAHRKVSETGEADSQNVGARLLEEANNFGKSAILGATAGFAGQRLAEQLGKDLKLSLPQVDFSGFKQEAPYHSEGSLSGLWHSVKHAFVKDESLDDKIRNHVKDKMTADEKKSFEAEDKALAAYKAAELAWMASTMLPPPPYPKRPDTPMHTELDQRVKDTEKKLTTEVRNSMSPTDLIRLDKQLSSFEQQVKEATLIKNPFGTGEPFRPMPKPGTTILDYYSRVAEQTEKFLKSDK